MGWVSGSAKKPESSAPTGTQCFSELTGTQLGYAPVSTEHQSLDQQVDALVAAGVESSRVYSAKLSGMSMGEQRPGLAALLDYAREGDAIVVVGIDRLGRNAAEVMTTIRELGERGIVLRFPSRRHRHLERHRADDRWRPGESRRA